MNSIPPPQHQGQNYSTPTHLDNARNPVRYHPDPNLNLSEQQLKITGHGSTDSGLYSIMDKPAMQSSSADTIGPDQMYIGGSPPVNEQPTKLSPEQLEAMYAKVNKPQPPPLNNMPSHAPTYGLTPASLPAGTNPPLNGNTPIRYTRPAPAGMRGSRDKLNISREGVDNEVYVTDDSHNTSKGSTGLNTNETDV